MNFEPFFGGNIELIWFLFRRVFIWYDVGFY